MHRASPTPRISVVLPVRNGAAYFEEALESVLSQTLRELELIVVDDGSTDRTPEILASAASRDRRVRLLASGSSGVVAALNEGCAAAAAPFVARLDADDVALPERLERQVAVLDVHPEVGLVGGAYFTIDEAGTRRATFRTPTHDAALRGRLAKYNVFASSAVTFRRDAFEQAGGYRLAPIEDYDLWLRISERWQLAAVPSQCSSTAFTPVRCLSLEPMTRRSRRSLRRQPRSLGGPRRGSARRDYPRDPELLSDLGFSTAEITRAADSDVRWATTLGEPAIELVPRPCSMQPPAQAHRSPRAGPEPATRSAVRHMPLRGRQVQPRASLMRARDRPSGSASELSAMLARHRPRRR